MEELEKEALEIKKKIKRLLDKQDKSDFRRYVRNKAFDIQIGVAR